jgi:hypothetical protein
MEEDAVAGDLAGAVELESTAMLTQNGTLAPTSNV